jgi:hypothetical protein
MRYTPSRTNDRTVLSDAWCTGVPCDRGTVASAWRPRNRSWPPTASSMGRPCRFRCTARMKPSMPCSNRRDACDDSPGTEAAICQYWMGQRFETIRAKLRNAHPAMCSRRIRCGNASGSISLPASQAPTADLHEEDVQERTSQCQKT